MDAEKIYLVPETHWDREWYLTLQEFRARLVLMMDKLLKILKDDPNYTNFTLDGQCIPLEDYLEVRPHKRELLEEFVKKKKLSVGPFYVLPDEFLVSGESLIRNLMIGNKIANNFGRVMKAGYIPDPFGHIAQLPQILYGCEIPSVLFWRGFGDEFENLNLDLEFEWQAPGNAASILAIHLISSYGSLADLDTSKRKGEYRKAIRRIKKVVAKLEEYTSTPYVLLNNGSDHTEAQPEIPNVINEWNDKNPEKPIEQNDFEKYINKIIEYDPSLKSFQGELRGGKYAPLLSGVFSTRMWIKQRNTEIEYLYEKYTEPIATISWILDQHKEYEFPSDYILTGLKWLIKNHPHDSICGCSIDQVHNEMITRFDWSEQIANEVIKNSCMSLSKIINLKENSKSNIPLIVFNPLPWKRKDVVRFNGITAARGAEEFPDKFKLIDADGSEIEYQSHKVKEVPRYTQESNLSSQFSFLAEVPACGYKVYYIKTDKSPREFR
ncbi:MAG: alpha-mannosidase, partial [Candidatus Lokiarchaeota archaeon]|nr:alpha-mannosidase [Candidatus Lokiarchaeota archaeon]MBD3199198.1 alpha-mannosidase [Candidatus Lokiarchaeota archaeon]